MRVFFIFTVFRTSKSINIKVKVVSLINYLSTTPLKHVGECRCSSNLLDLGRRWRWVVNLTVRLLYPQGKSPQYPLNGGWVLPRAGRNAVEWRKILLPCLESNAGCRACSPSLSRLRYPDLTSNSIQTLYIYWIKFVPHSNGKLTRITVYIGYWVDERGLDFSLCHRVKISFAGTRHSPTRALICRVNYAVSWSWPLSSI
jgi:hypothetical protein